MSKTRTPRIIPQFQPSANPSGRSAVPIETLDEINEVARWLRVVELAALGLDGMNEDHGDHGGYGACLSDFVAQLSDRLMELKLEGVR